MPDSPSAPDLSAMPGSAPVDISKPAPIATADEINAAALACAKAGTAVSLAAAAGLVVDPAPQPPVDSVEARLDRLEDEMAKLKSEFVTAMENLAHVASEDFKAVWAKVTAFMPFRIKR